MKHIDTVGQANARLIAAAPALLEALQNIIEHVADDDGISSIPVQRERIKQALDAIALAKEGKPEQA